MKIFVNNEEYLLVQYYATELWIKRRKIVQLTLVVNFVILLCACVETGIKTNINEVHHRRLELQSKKLN